MGSTLWSSLFHRMLWLLVVCVGVAIGQEVTDEVLDNINEPSGIALKDSFRCGLFFPDPADKSPDKSALPYLNLYIFNATFDAKSECESGSPSVKRYNDFCAQVWDKGGKGLVLTSPSLNKKRGADGISIGGDICNWVKTEGKLRLWGKTAKSSRMGSSLECIQTRAATNCGTGRAGSTTRLCAVPRDFTLLVISEVEKSQKLRQNILKIATKYLENCDKIS